MRFNAYKGGFLTYINQIELLRHTVSFRQKKRLMRFNAYKGGFI